MKLETLYKRAKTGAIQYWSISTLHDTIFKESGKLGTKNPIKHEEICTGKNIGKSNETTPGQQAKSQAQSDWNKKRDEGYKSLTDLGIIEERSNDGWVYVQDGKQLRTNGDPTGLEQILNTVLSEFNTDASGNVKPMLAQSVKWDKVKYPALVQPKLDGVRCLMVIGEESVVFLSRNGKIYTTINHIGEEVLGTFKNIVLDGEIYSDELTFQEIVTATKKQTENSLKLRFRVYDIVNDKVQQERWNDVVSIVDAIGSPVLWPVTTFTLNSKEEVMDYHNQWVQEGYEGAMIRHLDGKYGQGQRSSALLKVKEFDETEFAFKNFEFGQRGVEDLIAVLWTHDGEKEFRAKVMGNRSWKEQLYNDGDNLEGTSVTVKHFGYTDDGLPRFPIGKAFRDYE